MLITSIYSHRKTFQNLVMMNSVAKIILSIRSALSNSNRNSVNMATFSKNYLADYSFWIYWQARRIFFRLMVC